MLAETHGKISRIGSNLTERLEDNLTGNVFGALRYIPFSEGLGEILAKGVYPKEIGEDIHLIDCGMWSDKAEFWPYDREGEIDLMLVLPKVIMGIEVKYLSGLSSEDEVTSELEQVKSKEEKITISFNQLARESRIVSRRGKEKNKLLLFIADRKSCQEVYVNVVKRGIIDKGVKFGYISWQEFLKQLTELRLNNPFQQVIIQDLIALLKRKGFEDFTSMEVRLPVPINENDFFRFKPRQNPAFNFQLNLLISEEFHYEF
ncbi:hypothetical protein [Bacillus sp. AK031]